ncbi:hypothetical protein SAMN05216179_2962 [Gracilibacillus kekensis]|uniref:Uncharacterized protein n=1 Tax=Gracilibacillus kekensis TaxID=1027249 RepID=A0A1M7Q9V7_9BACI|nr:hypothetical protein SAMN05216179_2962 [Gracilibacillus kekensis]
MFHKMKALTVIRMMTVFKEVSVCFDYREKINTFTMYLN